MSRAWRTVDDFAPAAEAEALRGVFDERFRDPRSARGDRFVWDWWHVPGQYTALRTPAWEYFPKPIYEKIHRRIVAWGREALGCHPQAVGVGSEGIGDEPVEALELLRARSRSATAGEHRHSHDVPHAVAHDIHEYLQLLFETE